MKQGLVAGIIRSALWLASEHIQERTGTVRRVRDMARFQALRYLVAGTEHHLGVIRATEHGSEKNTLVVCDEPPRSEDAPVTAAPIDQRTELPLQAAKYFVHPLSRLGLECTLEMPLAQAVRRAAKAMNAIEDYERKAARARHEAAVKAAAKTATALN